MYFATRVIANMRCVHICGDCVGAKKCPVLKGTTGGRNSSLVVFGLAVHSVAGFYPPLGKFSSRGDFSLGVSMGSNSIPDPLLPKNFRMRV